MTPDDLPTRILLALPSASVSDLADRLGETRPEISACLGWLMDQGLVRRYEGKDRSGRPKSLREWRLSELGEDVMRGEAVAP